MAGNLLPNTELVAIAWLRGMGLLNVGTTLPGDESKWADEGFVQVTTVGGAPDVDIPARRPVVQIDFWAANSNSAKVPWGRANHLAERVYDATFIDSVSTMVTLETGANYRQARLMSAYALTEPRRVNDDPSGYARYLMDVQLNWVALPALVEAP